MNHLTRGFIFLGSIAWLSGAGYLLANTFTSKSKNKGSKEVITPSSTETKEIPSEFSWKYVSFVKGGMRNCDFLEKNKFQSELEKRGEDFGLIAIDCQKILPPEIKEEDNSFFWIEGEKEKINELFESKKLNLFDLWKDNSINIPESKWMERLKDSCKKNYSEAQGKITILCQN
ncbi:hypothetical protein MSUIS_05870 [Mycoplasma suis KI3806]|uniref:Uncharacterized protein n=1 Tax=Mycoplasma suis (strain KI_3806) TaxID=708248 RepID=F0V1Z9_MYCS3|nr:hypothetical protein [Mycoplasma suis]CBZ40680.1 hypothetical protein MSUIS_05870 [Mycoplasma suis KI3806]